MTPAGFLRARAREGAGFRAGLLGDARAAAAGLMLPKRERSRLGEWGLVVRLCWEADAFLALLLVRLGSALRARGIPLLPTLCRRLAITLAQVHIGAPVMLAPGIYLPHGLVVIDGLVSIGQGTSIRPFVTIGLKEGELRGPTIGARVMIGTGAKILGPITVGDGARIGANAVVVDDVPAGATVVGMPAREIGGAD
ncbi:MAG: serine acetyltransferase [Pseudomonadota bacterium]